MQLSPVETAHAVIMNRTGFEENDLVWSMIPFHESGETVKEGTVFRQRIYWDLNKILIMFITMCTLIMGVAGNVMILLTILIRRLMHNPMSYYMLNLAVVHTILSLVVCPFLTFQILRDTHYKRETCASFYILLYTMALLLGISVFTIGLDRLWRERYSWHYLSHHSSTLAVLLVVASWVLATTLTVGLELTRSVKHPLRNHVCGPGGGADLLGYRPSSTAVGDIVMEVIFYLCYTTALICLVLVHIVYGYKKRMFKHVPGNMGGDMLIEVPTAPTGKNMVQDFDIAKVAQTRLSQVNKQLFEDGDQEARSVRMFTLLFVLHTVCWLPFYVAYSLNTHVSPTCVPFHITEMVHYLAFLSSTLNPVIYYFFSVEFNVMIGHLLRVMCCHSSDLESGSSLSLDLERLEGVSEREMKPITSRAVVSRARNVSCSEMSVDIRPTTSNVAVTVGDGDITQLGSSYLSEVGDTDGPSADLLDWKKPQKRRRRRRRRPGSGRSGSHSTAGSTPAEATAGLSVAPDTSDPADSSVYIRPSRRGRGSSLRGDSASAERMLSPRSAADRSQPDHQSPDQLQSPAASTSPAHGIVASFKGLLRRHQRRDSQADSRQGHSGADQSQRSSTDTLRRSPAKRTPRFIAHMAALLRRRGASSPPPAVSQASLVSGRTAPSGAAAVPEDAGPQLVADVPQPHSGAAHRVDFGADHSPRSLERMVDTGSGYQTPTGKKIHHVCAIHHVHKRCHHHDWRNTAVPDSEQRRETSVANWMGVPDQVRAWPVSDQLSTGNDQPTQRTGRSPRQTSANSADSKY